MKKVIINNCLECPFTEENPKGPVANCICGIDDEERVIPDISHIPDWCSLEDA